MSKKKVGSEWIKVPDIFPHSDQLSDDYIYNLKRVGINIYEVRPSEKHYVEVRTIYEDKVEELLKFFGYSDWKNKYVLKKSFFGIFTSWKIKEKKWV